MSYVRTWSKISSATSLPALYGHCQAYLPGKGTFLFGGTVGNNYAAPLSKNILRWDWPTLNWVDTGVACPSGFAGSCATDRARGVILYFPAYRPDPVGDPSNVNALRGETYEWDGTTLTTYTGTFPLTTHSATAHGSQWGCMAYDEARAKMVMFSGSTPNGDVLYRSPWEWNTVTHAWESIGPSLANYVTDSALCAAYDRAHAKVIVEQGFGGPGVLSYHGAAGTDVTTESVTAPTDAGGSDARYMSLAYNSALSAVVLKSKSKTYSLGATTWSALTLASEGPTGGTQAAAAMSYDESVRAMIYSGGVNPGPSPSADTWVMYEPALLSITVTPVPSAPLSLGSIVQFTATASYEDGSTANVTSIATWTSARPSVVTVSSSGLAVVVSDVNGGAIAISAQIGSVIGSVVVNVPDTRNNIVKLLTTLVLPGQSIEDTLQSFLTERSVDTAIGAQLDLIGKIVGESRGGLDDDTYRRYIRARVSVNRSNGLTEDLIKVAGLIINNVAATITVANQPPAAVELAVGAIGVSDVIANVLVDLLEEAVSAGVRLLLSTQYVDDAHSFTTARATWLTSGSFAGATSLAVDAASLALMGLPPSGTLDLDLGTPVAEVVTYSSLGTATITCAALSNAHSALAAVQVRDASTDQGFATAAILTSASSVGATTLTVDSTVGFASSGSLRVDYETSGSQETLTYTGKTSTTFTGLSAALAHSSGALVRPVTGLLGGRFAATREADYVTPEIDYP